LVIDKCNGNFHSTSDACWLVARIFAEKGSSVGYWDIAARNFYTGRARGAAHASR